MLGNLFILNISCHVHHNPKCTEWEVLYDKVTRQNLGGETKHNRKPNLRYNFHTLPNLMINSSSSQLFPNFYVLLVPLLVSSFAALFSFILLSSFLILFAGMSQFRVAILYSCACMSCMTVIHPSKHVSFISICAWLHKAEIHPVCHHPAHTNQ